jgi:septal ring factor EnvC (AmiA/AmiB activator)
MGLGSTAKKIQVLADRAEQLYVKLKEVHERVLSVEETVDDTQDRVRELEQSLEHQRAVLDALAEERGLEVDTVVAEAAIEDADGRGADGQDADGQDADGQDAGTESAQATAGTTEGSDGGGDA